MDRDTRVIPHVDSLSPIVYLCLLSQQSQHGVSCLGPQFPERRELSVDPERRRIISGVDSDTILER